MIAWFVEHWHLNTRSRVQIPAFFTELGKRTRLIYSPLNNIPLLYSCAVKFMKINFYNWKFLNQFELW